MHTLTLNFDVLAELTSLTLDLDTVMEVLLKGRAVEDTITGRTGVIDDELVLSSSFTSSGLGLEKTLQKKRKGEKPRLAY